MTAPSAVPVDVAAMATMAATIAIKVKSRRIAVLLLGVAPTPCGFGGAPTRRPFARPQGSMTLPLCINRVKFDATRAATDAGALPGVGGSNVLPPARMRTSLITLLLVLFLYVTVARTN